MSRAYGHPFTSLQVEALEARNLLSSAEYVTGLYQDLLHRAPATAEVTNWVFALDSGSSPFQLAQAITGSVEFQSNVIRSDYVLFLGRQPAQAEVDGWATQLQNGLTENQVEANFLASDEFFAKQGNTIDSWLQGLYHDVLGRQADAGGLADWKFAVQNGLPRQNVALAIVQSPEANARLIDAVYHDLLRRAPDAGGADAWFSALRGGLTPAGFLAQIAGSGEYIGIVAHGMLDVPPVVAGSPGQYADMPDPFGAQPPFADPYVYNPAPVDTGTSDPGYVPAPSDPVTSDPGNTSDPVTSDPVTSDPGGSDSSGGCSC